MYFNWPSLLAREAIVGTALFSVPFRNPASHCYSSSLRMQEGRRANGRCRETCAPHSQDHPAFRSSTLDTEGDYWIALDKVQHFAVCALLVIAGYLGAITSSKHYRYRILVAVATAAIFAAGKELGDYLQVGIVYGHTSPLFLKSARKMHF